MVVDWKKIHREAEGKVVAELTAPDGSKPEDETQKTLIEEQQTTPDPKLKEDANGKEKSLSDLRKRSEGLEIQLAELSNRLKERDDLLKVYDYTKSEEYAEKHQKPLEGLKKEASDLVTLYSEKEEDAKKFASEIGGMNYIEMAKRLEQMKLPDAAKGKLVEVWQNIQLKTMDLNRDLADAKGKLIEIDRRRGEQQTMNQQIQSKADEALIKEVVEDIKSSVLGYKPVQGQEEYNQRATQNAANFEEKVRVMPRKEQLLKIAKGERMDEFFADYQKLFDELKALKRQYGIQDAITSVVGSFGGGGHEPQNKTKKTYKEIFNAHQ